MNKNVIDLNIKRFEREVADVILLGSPGKGHLITQANDAATTFFAALRKLHGIGEEEPQARTREPIQ